MKEYLESKKILAMLWGVSLTLSSGTALAACVPGDCSGLGYTKSASDCSGVDYIRCPFDTSKYYCVKPADDTCPSGYSKTPCISSQIQTGTTTTAAGSICYLCDNTAQKICPSGTVAACPSGQFGTSVIYGKQTCYKGCINPVLNIRASFGGNRANDEECDLDFDFTWIDAGYTDDQKAALEEFKEDKANIDVIMPRTMSFNGSSYSANGSQSNVTDGTSSETWSFGRSNNNYLCFSSDSSCFSCCKGTGLGEVEALECLDRSRQNLFASIMPDRSNPIIMDGVNVFVTYDIDANAAGKYHFSAGSVDVNYGEFFSALVTTEVSSNYDGSYNAEVGGLCDVRCRKASSGSEEQENVSWGAKAQNVSGYATAEGKVTLTGAGSCQVGGNSNADTWIGSGGCWITSIRITAKGQTLENQNGSSVSGTIY